MKNKKTAILLFLSIFLLSVSLVMGTLTHNTPSTTGETINGTFLFNTTTDMENTLNCTWATTADGVFAITLNESSNQKTFINSTDTASLVTDAEDTTVTILCTNVTGTTDTNTIVINVDNTDPVCSFSVDTDITQVYSASGVQTTQASTDTTDITYAWTLYDPNGNSKTTSTSASPSFSITDFDQIGDFIIGLIVTDEAGKTNACTNDTIMVSGSDSSSDDIIDGGTTTTTTTNYKLIGILVMILFVVIICAVGGFFVISSMKKK